MKSLTVCFFVLLCVFQMGCRNTTCDVPKAVNRTQSYESQPLYAITLGLKNDIQKMSLVPDAVSLEEIEGPFVRQTHLASGMKIQLLDAKGEVLFEDNIPNLLITRETIGAEVLKNGVSAEIAELDRMIQEQKFVAEVPRIDHAATIRLVAVDPNVTLSSANMVFDFKLTSLPRTKRGDDEMRDARVQAIHYSGPANSRLNFILLGDGYREEELDRFRSEAEELKKDMLNVVPYSDYQNYYNIWRVDLPSKESGAICDDDQVHSRHNRYGTIFPIACLNALFKTHYSDRFLMQLNALSVWKASRLVRENGKTVPSQVFVLANSPKYGGTAVVWASMSNGSPWGIFTHELGHSFGGLADEYVAEGDACNTFGIFSPNVSVKKTEAKSVKWGQWIESGTPIPTPDDASFEKKVGLFQGSSDCKKIFYRPERTCKMKTNYGDYCSICREQVMLRLYDYTRPLQGDLQITSQQDGQYLFNANVLKTELQTSWYVDGKEVESQPGYRPYSAKLSPGPHTVALAVHDLSPYVRREECHLFEARAASVLVPTSTK